LDSLLPSSKIQSGIAFESYLYGVVATLEHDHESAERFYVESLQSDPVAGFWNHYRLAFTYQKLQRLDEAFIHYGTCIGLQPKFAWPKFNLGLVCLKANHLKLSETYITQAIRTDPQFGAAYVALMAVYIKQGKPQEAIRVFETAKSLGIESAELDANLKIANKL
ncbi:MAG: hypothetical protein AAF483_14110, partial [Planctomycetota bacterium]